MDKKFEESQLKKSIEQTEFHYKETAKEKELLNSEIESSHELRGAWSSKIIFVKLKDNGKGIFKPKSGESYILQDAVKEGFLYTRERAAYLVDRFLGFDLVPPTVIREINRETGSFQEFVEDTKKSYDIKDQPKTEMKKLWIFDLIIWNSDRYDKNLLFDKKGKRVYAIDNNFSFGGDRSHPYEYEQFFRKPIPSEIKDKLNNLFYSDNKKNVLKDLLEELLPKKQIEALFNRLESITNLINEKGSIDGEINFEGELITKEEST